MKTQIARCTRDEAVDLEVDTETGQVEVLKIASAYDVGKAINPDLVLMQIEGGAVHGMSSAFETLCFDEQRSLRRQWRMSLGVRG